MPIEAPKTLAALRDAEAKCTRCPLYKSATQVVPGEGPQRADLVRAKKLSGQNEKSI
jgi:DNA polymerase